MAWETEEDNGVSQLGLKWASAGTIKKLKDEILI